MTWYRLYTWDPGATDNDACSWRYRLRCRWRGLRRAIRRMYAEGCGRSSILVKSED